MFNNSKESQRPFRRDGRDALALGLTIGMVLLSTVGRADTAAPIKDLKLETRESVRAVGQALLHAKRSYAPDPAGSALRDDIKAVRNLVIGLAEPLPTTAIQIQSTSATSPVVTQSTGPSVSPATAWRQARSAEIGRLRSAVANMKSQSRAMGKKSAGAQQSSPSLLDSIVTFFTGMQQDADGAHTSIVTPVTTHALSRLEGLDVEIEAVLVLPAAERQQRLRELVASLSPGDPSSRLHNVEEKPVSPTMSTRTQHRRTW